MAQTSVNNRRIAKNVFLMRVLMNKVYNMINRKQILFARIITTAITYAKLLIQNVNIGKKCIFYGNTTFNVDNGGGICIGNNCIFRSNATSNRIGLNHRCIISATPLPNLTCKIEIGENCGFSGTSIWCFKSIKIGNNVRCGANTLIMDGDAHFEDSRTAPPRSIVIENNVFIGANTVVKKGVTIGENSVIGMNSVVTHDIPANSIAVGIPCKVIRKIETKLYE